MLKIILRRIIKSIRERVYLCQTKDVPEGSLKQIDVSLANTNLQILVTRLDTEIKALSSKCPHALFPLIQGQVVNDKLYCPLHCATFSIKTGYQQYGPSFGSLINYETHLEGDRVYLELPENGIEEVGEIPSKLKPKSERKDNSVFAIVGGGISALSACLTLRQSGHQGRIVVLSKEPLLPYDRTRPSKKLIIEIPSLKSQPHFNTQQIEFIKNASVENIDVEKQNIRYSKKGKQ